MTAKGPSRERIPRFVLASGSPRRRELLERAGYQFEIISPAVAEVAGEWLTVRETTTGNAMRKALAIAEQVPDAVVLGADTLVALDGQVIGKPTDLDDANRILRRLSNREHEVWTSVFVCHFALEKVYGFQELSMVRFRKLDDDVIARYLAKVNSLDKAGAYAAQGHGTEIIERIDGSYTNVVGLPMEMTERVLREFGVTPRRAE